MCSCVFAALRAGSAVALLCCFNGLSVTACVRLYGVGDVRQLHRELLKSGAKGKRRVPFPGRPPVLPTPAEAGVPAFYRAAEGSGGLSASLR